MADDDDLAGFRHLHGEVDELFADLMGVRGAVSAARALTDVYLTDEPAALNVTVDVAGLDPHSLEVVLDRDVLSVRGRRRRPEAAGRRVYHHAEIDWGPFERRIRIATPVDPGAATVTYVHGLLQIALPLAPRPVVARVLIGVRIP
jgi:HSP20 family protein